MDTVQLLCGQCKNVMAISAAHLGQQVQCPHCKAVVQTPAPAPAPISVPTAFEPAPSPPPAPEPQPPTVETSAAVSMLPPTAPPEEDFTQFKPKPRKDRSVFLIIALIFLVPYAITMTIFVIIMSTVQRTDPFEYLPDPAPSEKKGGPRKVQRMQPKHDNAIAAHRKTTLGKSVQAGDIIVTPLKVVLTPENDLKLILRAANASTNTSFEPMHDSYVNESRTTALPYTFLESRSTPLSGIFSHYLAYHKNRQATDEPMGDAVLAPNGETTVVLVTTEKYRKTHVAQIAKSTSDDFTWRVQVRRGFVEVNRKHISATTVIGVDFSSKEIEREGKS